MNACSAAVDFSIQSVAISLVMDLVGLTQSVAVVAGETENGLESSQPLSPNQGRVSVVIRPPLTEGNLRYMAEKTDFFKVGGFSHKLFCPSHCGPLLSLFWLFALLLTIIFLIPVY